jgi:hypothetical protein
MGITVKTHPNYNAVDLLEFCLGADYWVAMWWVPWRNQAKIIDYLKYLSCRQCALEDLYLRRVKWMAWLVNIEETMGSFHNRKNLQKIDFQRTTKQFWMLRRVNCIVSTPSIREYFLNFGYMIK